MKRGGGLHPPRPGWWPPTQRPRAAPGHLIAAGATNSSRREGEPPGLRTSTHLGGTLGFCRTSWRIPFPRHASDRGAVPSAVGGRVGGLPPLFFCGCCGCLFLAFPGWWGEFCGCGALFCRFVAFWWSLSPVQAVVPFIPAHPPPFVWISFGLCFVHVPVAGGRPLPRRGGVPACPGCLFLRPFGGCEVVVGRFFWLGVFGLGGVVSRCPISGSPGCRPCCCLAGGVACLGEVAVWLRVCVTVPHAFFLSPWLAGVGPWAGVGRWAFSCS